MSSAGNVSKNQIVNNKTFSEFQSKTLSRYEKTTNDQEKVDGLWLKKGSSDYQAKIWTAASRAIALATKARASKYIPEVSGVSDNNYQQDTKPLSAVQGSGFRAYVPLLDGQSVTIHDEIEPTTGGKSAKRAQGQKTGIALETVAASGADADLLIEVCLDDTKIWLTETISASANSVILTNTNPYLIDYIEITTGTATGGLVKTSGTPVQGEAKVDYTNAKISTNNSDGAVNVKVRYLY